MAEYNKDICGKKLLILAGAKAHCKVVKAAKELGVYTIVTDYLDLDHSPAKQIADEYWDLDIMAVDSIVQKCQEEQVDGVITFCIDPAQIPYMEICEKLKIPCYGTRRQFEIMTNKRRFKDFCMECGVDVIPEYTLEEIETQEVVYPVLVKPLESRGSRGQTVCHNKQEVLVAVEVAKSESRDHQFLIEKYMGEKRDFALAYIVIDSKPYITKIGDRYLGAVEDHLERQHICTILPSAFMDTYIHYVDPKVKHFIHALDIKFGAVFLQGFIDGNQVLFYDPAMRFPGSDYDIVLDKATGFSTMKSMVLFALTGNVNSCFGAPEDAFRLNGKIGMILSITARPGNIARFDGVQEIIKDPRIISTEIRYSVGEQVPATGDIKQRIAEFVLMLEHQDEAKEFANKVFQLLKVENEKGEDLLISKMGIDIPFTIEMG